LIALSISPFINRQIIALDGFVPLPGKISGATTEKNDNCRVKEKIEMGVMFLWRQEIGEKKRGFFDVVRGARLFI
jgi:hypothetical protein